MAKKTENQALVTFRPGAVAAFDFNKPPALPAVLKSMEGLSEPKEVVELTQQLLGAADTSEFDLKRYRVGRGGSTNWTFEEFGEESSTKEIVCVILATGIRRAYYHEKFGAGESGAPPDCSSDDGVVGFGVLPQEALKVMGAKLEDGNKAKGGRGFSCQDCPFSQFGSAVNDDGSEGRGQRCNMVRPLYVLAEGDKVPSVVVLTPASLGASKKFLTSFMRTGTPLFSVKVKLALEKSTAGGFPHARATFSLAGRNAKESTVPKGDPWYDFLSQLSDFVKVSMLPQFRVQSGDVGADG